MLMWAWIDWISTGREDGEEKEGSSWLGLTQANTQSCQWPRFSARSAFGLQILGWPLGVDRD